jgi:hypothetical protein
MSDYCQMCGQKLPGKSRTTGPHSQNHAEFGFSEQISRWMNDGTSKREVLVEAMVRAGIEPTINRFGRRVMKESNLSMKEASRVIEELKEIARFFRCPLREE